MSIQECVGFLSSMEFQPQGNSPHRVLDYNTRIIFSRNESHISVFALQRSREIAHGNAEQATMAIVIWFSIIRVVRSILQLHRTQISLHGTDAVTGMCWLPLMSGISTTGCYSTSRSRLEYIHSVPTEREVYTYIPSYACTM